MAWLSPFPPADQSGIGESRAPYLRKIFQINGGIHIDGAYHNNFLALRTQWHRHTVSRYSCPCKEVLRFSSVSQRLRCGQSGRGRPASASSKRRKQHSKSGQKPAGLIFREADHRKIPGGFSGFSAPPFINLFPAKAVVKAYPRWYFPRAACLSPLRLWRRFAAPPRGSLHMQALPAAL